MRLKKTPIEGQCRIAGCKDSARLRGFCKPHYQEAYRRRLLDSLGLPSARRGRKPAVVPEEVVPPVVVPAVAPQIGTLDTLRTERDAAIVRAEIAEKALELRVQQCRLIQDSMNRIAASRDEAKAQGFDFMDKICAVLGIIREGGSDWVLEQIRQRVTSIANHEATPAIRCGSALVFEVGGETPTATLIGDREAIQAFGRLGLYRECPVYETEAGLLLCMEK